MAYTKEQLVDAYTAANLGKGPDQATTLTLDAYASQSQVGGISDETALASTLKLVNGTTAVAIETYQFFTGKAPSEAGLEYLINSDDNASDLNDASGLYGTLTNQENRFINFSINLGVFGEGSAAFATSYTGVTYAQVVDSAYDKIIGKATAAAAGVDVDAAVAFLSRTDNINFLKAWVAQNGITDPVQADLAVKAALVGQILNVATVSGLGAYAAATNAMLTDLSDGTLTNPAAASIFETYPSAGGGVVGKTFALTDGIDALVGTANDDTFTGSATAVALSNTANPLDTIDGGAGVDTLNLSNSGAAGDLTVSELSVKNVEIVNLTSATGLEAGALDTTGWTGVTNLNVVLKDAGASESITASGTTAISLTASKVETGDITVNGGKAVTVNTTGNTGGDLTIGNAAAPTGIVTATVKAAYDSSVGGDVTLGNISVKGGSSVTIDQSYTTTAAQATAIAAGAVTNTVNFGDVTVTGTSATTSVTVTQGAEATESQADFETATGTFAALADTASVTFNGLTYTNNTGGALTGIQVAAAFANLDAGDTTGAGAGAYSGTFGGYATGSNGGTATVTATATTLGNKTDLTNSPGVTVAVTNQGSNTAGVVGVTTGNVTITDVNAASGTAAGKITTVTLENGTQSISSNALTTLNLSGENDTTVTLSKTNTTTSKTLTINLDGGDSLVTDANDVLTTVNVVAKSEGSLGLDAESVKTLNVSGDEVLTLGSSNLVDLKTVNVSGAGGLTADLTGYGDLTKIDTTNSTGVNTITIDGSTPEIQYVGGAGVDTVTLSGTMDEDASIKLGGGNDRLLSDGSGVITEDNTVDGGAGIDAISSALISAVNADVFKNFEVLNLDSTLNDTVDVSLISGSNITTLELNGGSGSAEYTHVELSQTLSVTGDATGSDATIQFDGATGDSDAYSITFAAAGAAKVADATAINAGFVTIADIETVTIHSGSSEGFTANKIAIDAEDATKVVVDGSQALNLAFTGSDEGIAIDASAATGAITIDLNSVTAINGGITDGLATLTTGSGADVITVGSIDGVVEITTGGGKDSINVSATVGLADNDTAHVWLKDFSATDKLVFSNAGTSFDSTKVDLTGINDFADALDAAATNNGEVTWFQYGNNTYIVENATGAGFNGADGDIVVKLSGKVDLSTAVFDAGTHTFTLA